MIEVPRAVHCWVSLTTVWKDDGVPGLLLGWRRGEQGWEGYVIAASPGIGAHASGPYLRQCWIPAAAIRPVEG